MRPDRHLFHAVRQACVSMSYNYALACVLACLCHLLYFTIHRSAYFRASCGLPLLSMLPLALMLSLLLLRLVLSLALAEAAKLRVARERGNVNSTNLLNLAEI